MSIGISSHLRLVDKGEISVRTRVKYVKIMTDPNFLNRCEERRNSGHEWFDSQSPFTTGKKHACTDMCFP